MEPADHHRDDIAYLTALIRAHDRPRYYATLFAPADTRGDLCAIFGFAAEIGRIPNAVSEPQLGEIRLRWWQDALATGEAADAPAIRALTRTVKRHALPVRAFEALAEATAFDLYADPPATIGDLEGRLGETQSALFQMAAIVMGAEPHSAADAAGHAGVAYGLATRLAALATDRAHGRIILPADMLAAEGVAPVDVFAFPPPEGLQSVVNAAVKLARRHLDDARRHIAALPAATKSAFLPLTIAAPLLKRVERAGPDIVVRQQALSDIGMLARIARTGWFGT